LGDKWHYALLVLIIALIFSRLLQNAVGRHLKHDDQSDEVAIRIYKKVTRFVVMVPGILLAIHVLGINMILPQFQTPLSNRFITDFNATISENVFNITKAQCESMIEPNNMTDNLFWVAMT